MNCRGPARQLPRDAARHRHGGRRCAAWMKRLRGGLPKPSVRRTERSCELRQTAARGGGMARDTEALRMPFKILQGCRCRSARGGDVPRTRGTVETGPRVYDPVEQQVLRKKLSELERAIACDWKRCGSTQRCKNFRHFAVSSARSGSQVRSNRRTAQPAHGRARALPYNRASQARRSRRLSSRATLPAQSAAACGKKGTSDGTPLRR